MLTKSTFLALALTIGATTAAMAQPYDWYRDNYLRMRGYYGTPYGPGPDYGSGGGDQYGYGPGYSYGTQAPSAGDSSINSVR